MKLKTSQIKQRYFDKVYANAPIEPCACGCGQLLKTKDKYGRDRRFVSGHNGRKYTDPKEHKRAWNHRNRKQRHVYRRQRVRQIKTDLINAAGSKCSCCGLPFNECTAVFDFHHKQPDDKKFSLNNASIDRYSLDIIKAEASKCTLLCANCHRMVHWDWEA